MPLQNYKCKKCKHVFTSFKIIGKNNKVVCPKCYSDAAKTQNMPIKESVMERTDSYRGVHSLKGIEEDLKARNKAHSYEELQETIEEFGIDTSKSMGWLDSKGNMISKDEFINRKR